MISDRLSSRRCLITAAWSIAPSGSSGAAVGFAFVHRFKHCACHADLRAGRRHLRALHQDNDGGERHNHGRPHGVLRLRLAGALPGVPRIPHPLTSPLGLMAVAISTECHSTACGLCVLAGQLSIAVCSMEKFDG